MEKQIKVYSNIFKILCKLCNSRYSRSFIEKINWIFFLSFWNKVQKQTFLFLSHLMVTLIEKQKCVVDIKTIVIYVSKHNCWFINSLLFSWCIYELSHLAIIYLDSLRNFIKITVNRVKYRLDFLESFLTRHKRILPTSHMTDVVSLFLENILLM